jgi:hypothetical protein
MSLPGINYTGQPQTTTARARAQREGRLHAAIRRIQLAKDSKQESSTTQQPVGANCARPDTTPTVAAMAHGSLNVARADDETKPHSPVSTVTE